MVTHQTKTSRQFLNLRLSAGKPPQHFNSSHEYPMSNIHESIQFKTTTTSSNSKHHVTSEQINVQLEKLIDQVHAVHTIKTKTKMISLMQCDRNLLTQTSLSNNWSTTFVGIRLNELLESYKASA